MAKKYENIEVRLNMKQIAFVNRIANDAGVRPEQAMAVMLALFIREQDAPKEQSP
jgi:hypothetical protein